MPYGIVLSDSITDSSGGILAPSSSVFRNRIINGDMRIDQRRAGASVTPTANGYTLDRWNTFLTQASKFSIQQNAASVTPPVGFTNYLGATSTSAYSVSSSDYFLTAQIIEGLNIADLAWGTASAAPITLSFWVRSSLTGTFGGALQNSGGTRSYPFTYTINSANTWEKETITIAGDTSGTWLTTNGGGITLYFSLGSGATFSGTAGAWAGSNFVSATGATSVVGTNGATFYITGVQLEKGSTATSFDYRDYGRELMLCQRYYYRITPGAVAKPLTQTGWNSTSSTAIGINKFPVTMRIAPTALEQSGTTNQYVVINLNTSTACTSVPAFANSTTEQVLTTFTTGATMTAGQASVGYTDGTNGATAYLGWSAEL
jgi:hypothetical protein